MKPFDRATGVPEEGVDPLCLPEMGETAPPQGAHSLRGLRRNLRVKNMDLDLQLFTI